MTEETASPSVEKAESEAAPMQEGQKPPTAEEALEFLKEMHENAGQMSEIVKEEETLVIEFFGSLLKILKPFGRTLDIAVSSLPKGYGERVSKAYLYLSGQLVLVYKNGEVEILNLSDTENREILIEIMGEIMLKLKSMIDSYKSKAEKRVNFLMSITKELQKVAKAFAE